MRLPQSVKYVNHKLLIIEVKIIPLEDLSIFRDKDASPMYMDAYILINII